MSLKTYQESLSKKLIGAGSVIRDAAGRILLVKPTYHDGWITVGGIVEAGESPLEAAMREMKEEIGIAVTPKRLLGVGYLRESEDRPEMLAFTFDAGVISGELIVPRLRSILPRLIPTGSCLGMRRLHFLPRCTRGTLSGSSLRLILVRRYIWLAFDVTG